MKGLARHGFLLNLVPCSIGVRNAASRGPSETPKRQPNMLIIIGRRFHHALSMLRIRPCDPRFCCRSGNRTRTGQNAPFIHVPQSRVKNPFLCPTKKRLFFWETGKQLLRILVSIRLRPRSQCSGTYGPSSRTGAGWSWWDLEGGEWHLHHVDPFHPVARWDYNPWTAWNSPGKTSRSSRSKDLYGLFEPCVRVSYKRAKQIESLVIILDSTEAVEKL